MFVTPSPLAPRQIPRSSPRFRGRYTPHILTFISLETLPVCALRPPHQVPRIVWVGEEGCYRSPLAPRLSLPHPSDLSGIITIDCPAIPPASPFQLAGGPDGRFTTPQPFPRSPRRHPHDDPRDYSLFVPIDMPLPPPPSPPPPHQKMKAHGLPLETRFTAVTNKGGPRI